MVISALQVESRGSAIKTMQTFTSRTIGSFSFWLFYIVTVFGLAVVFNQGDLTHTLKSAYAYLDGHFSDFYEENTRRLGGLDYLPLIYLIFASWDYLFGFLGINVQANELAGFVAAKTLLACFFVGCAILIKKIASNLSGNERSGIVASILFASSPLAVFCVFIFSGYDIIGLFFSLLGILYYFKKKPIRFALLFSIAASFKYFAIIPFVPLLLNIEKNPIKLLTLSVLVLLVPAAQFFLYIDSSAFRVSCCTLFLSKVSGAVGASTFSNIPQKLGFILLCFYSYASDPESFGGWKYKAIYYIELAYALMFMSVVWHPQWFVLLTPFLAIIYVILPNHVGRNVFLLFEALAVFAYYTYVFNAWKHNVDAEMALRGAFRFVIDPPHLILSDFFTDKLIGFSSVFLSLFLFSPFLIYALTSTLNNRILQEQGYMLYFSRFAYGIYLFIVPTVISFMMPLDEARKIRPEAGYRIEELSSGATDVIGEISSGDQVSQSIYLREDHVHGIGLLLATYNRPTSGHVRITIKDSHEGVLFDELFDCRDLKDNSWRYFIFKQPLNLSSQFISLHISSDDSPPGASITVWSEKGSSNLAFNGKPIPYSLSVRSLIEK